MIRSDIFKDEGSNNFLDFRHLRTSRQKGKKHPHQMQNVRPS